MRKIKIFLFSIWLVILIIPATIPARAEDNCAWRAEVTLTNPELGTSQMTGGCYSNETRPEAGSETNCLATPRPADSSSGYAYTRYICCCKEAIPAPIITAPKFIMPELQIKIPTLDLTEPECTLNEDGSYHCEIPWLGQYIIAIYNYGLSVAGILAAIVLMAGGVLWLISGGDASKVTQAKELIVGSVVGLIILASSYIILTQINPDLVKFKAISIGTIRGKQVSLATSRNSTKAADFKNASCATEDELANGVEFYATGYYKPAWEDNDNFRCVVAMQCSCPLGQDTTKNCDQLYGKNFPGYHPCKAFPENTPYCNMTASGSAPKDGDIAGPGNCLDTLPYGSKVCFRGQTYTITDTGGGIRGKRIDVWSGDNLNKALSVTGTGTLTKGPCGQTGNNTACNNCVNLTIPFKDGNQVDADLADKLIIAWNNSNGLAWQVTEAYPPTVTHASACHYNGQCADVGLTTDRSCAAVAELTAILENTGLSVLNEYIGCGGIQTTYSNAGHLHVQ
ncbi:MAG: hypothetical protein Q8N57_04025 [bacterium]|nr:hypothetical protein [bacterium]